MAKRARGPVRKLRRFDDGGPVRQVDSSVPSITPGPNAQIYQPQTQSTGSQVMQGINTGLNVATAYKKFQGGKDGGGGSGSDSKPADTSMSGGSGPGNPTAGARKGGPIRKTYGPRIGKEDGIIAAQKGEYVVRKSAVNKLGKKALDTINRGKLPNKGASRGR